MREPRHIALDSYTAISRFLFGKSPKAVIGLFPDLHTLDLYHHVPLPEHKGLVLIFQPGKGGGAKFSRREDGTHTITLYITHGFNHVQWEREFPESVFAWFSERRSSYVHEFVHYLEFREITDPTTVSPPDVTNDKAYYNHPSEIKAYVQQGLHNLEYDLDQRSLLRKDRFQKAFGTTKQSFTTKALSTYFNREFLTWLGVTEKARLGDILSSVYDSLSGKLTIAEAVREAVRRGLS